MGGDDDPVEPRNVPTGFTDIYSVQSPGDVGDGARPADVRQHCRETLDVGARASGDGVPLRRTGDPKHPVVVQEPEEVPGRVEQGDLTSG